MLIKDAIVLRLQQICRERNIRYNELANRSGVTPSTVYSLMSPSRRDLSVITLKKLCDGLDMTITQFFDDPLFQTLEQELQYLGGPRQLSILCFSFMYIHLL